MNKVVNAAVAVAMMASAVPASAQMSVAAVAAPVAVTPAAEAVSPMTPQAAQLLLKSGTAIRLIATSAVTSKTAKVGDTVTLKVARDVIVQHQLVVPAGALATGEVTRVKRNGRMVSCGQLDVKVQSVEIEGAQVPLNMLVKVKGKDTFGTSGPIDGLLSFGPFAAVIFGHSAIVNPGTKVKGKLVADVQMAALQRPSKTATAAL